MCKKNIIVIYYAALYLKFAVSKCRFTKYADSWSNSHETYVFYLYWEWGKKGAICITCGLVGILHYRQHSPIPVNYGKHSFWRMKTRKSNAGPSRERTDDRNGVSLVCWPLDHDAPYVCLILSRHNVTSVFGTVVKLIFFKPPSNKILLFV